MGSIYLYFEGRLSPCNLSTTETVVKQAQTYSIFCCEECKRKTAFIKKQKQNQRSALWILRDLNPRPSDYESDALTS